MGKFSACSSDSSDPDFLRFDTGINAHDNSDSDSFKIGVFLSSPFVEKSCSNQDRQQIVEAERNLGVLQTAVPRNDEIKPQRTSRNSADDVWREIMAGKKSQHTPKEEMMTLEDFLVKTGAVEDKASSSTEMVSLKEESLDILPRGNSSGAIGIRVGMDVGDLKGKRSLSLLDPLDKAAMQKQRRMIKNRESAARSRERKQAHQFELEAMAMKLEQENRQLLLEKAQRMKKRRKEIMENVIPVVEKQQTMPRIRRAHSTLW